MPEYVSRVARFPQRERPMPTAIARDHTANIPTEAQAIVAALDGRQMGTREQGWKAQVLGIHVDEGDLWVQVARDNDPATIAVLRLSRHATASHAIVALEHCQPVSDAGPRVINVMRRL